jgi:hypothetical protein
MGQASPLRAPTRPDVLECSAQSYAYLALFSLLCQYAASNEFHTLRDRSRVLGPRSRWLTPKSVGASSSASTRGFGGLLARWYLLLFADTFGTYGTKRALKLMSGRLAPRVRKAALPRRSATGASSPNGSSGSPIASLESWRSARTSKPLNCTPTKRTRGVQLTLFAEESTPRRNVASTSAPAPVESGRNWGGGYFPGEDTELRNAPTSNMLRTSRHAPVLPCTSSWLLTPWADSQPCTVTQIV